jgi:hypothetical protein
MSLLISQINKLKRNFMIFSLILTKSVNKNIAAALLEMQMSLKLSLK